MNHRNCAIWSTLAKSSSNGELSQYDSPRAGGTYCVTKKAEARLSAQTAELRAKLTTWIIDQHRAGENWPKIDSNIIRQVEGQRRLRISEKKARFFQWLISTEYTVGIYLDLYGTNGSEDQYPFQAWTECTSDEESSGFAQLLAADGSLAEDSSGEYLTPLGFARLEEMELGGAPTNRAFVAMWFNPEIDGIYDNAIAPAVKAAGYEPIRIDRKEHNNRIDDEIVAEIRQSRFIIADFTCGIFEVENVRRAEARGGVYYEAGFAMGLGTPVIWTVRKDCIDHVHFDTRQFPHIVWDEPDGFRRALYNRIAAVIGVRPGAPGL